MCILNNIDTRITNTLIQVNSNTTHYDLQDGRCNNFQVTSHVPVRVVAQSAHATSKGVRPCNPNWVNCNDVIMTCPRSRNFIMSFRYVNYC